MATLTVNNLWAFLQSLSLTASNEQWLAEKLYESAAKKRNTEDAAKVQILDNLFGAWDNSADTDAMEKTILESRNSH